MKEESKEDEGDEDFDLFGSDDDEDEEVIFLTSCFNS